MEVSGSVLIDISWGYDAVLLFLQQLAFIDMRGWAVSWGLQGRRQKEMSFKRSLCKIAFSAGTFKVNLMERPLDETIVCCRAGLRELCGADCATEHGTGPMRRKMRLYCTALSLLLALLMLSRTLQISTVWRTTFWFCEELP